MPIKRALKGLATCEERGNQLWFSISSKNLLKALKILKSDFNAQRINTITGYDDGTNIFVIYHMTVSQKLVNLKVKLPHKNPSIPTISPDFPSARLYERDIHEMLGINVEGMKDKSRLFLPESYKGKPPLLKN